VDRESAFKEVWRAELLARLALLDQVISEQASRTEFARERGWGATTFERRSRLLEATRQHYVALLKQVLVDGKLPLWNDLDPGGADATTRNY
jgi:Trp operon repressor